MIKKERMHVILHEMAVHVLKDDELWAEIAHELDLSDDELSRVWDHARAKLRDREGLRV